MLVQYFILLYYFIFNHIYYLYFIVLYYFILNHVMYITNFLIILIIRSFFNRLTI